MSIVKVTDFDKPSDILISTNDHKEQQLETVITRVELEVLRPLFGKELYDLFIEDLALVTIGDPTADRFIAVFNEFYIDEELPVIESQGIKEMLKRFIWCEYVRKQPIQNAVVGMVKNEQENSSIASGSEYGWHQIYNEAVKSYSSIQILMLRDDTLYPEFKGIHKHLAPSI